MSDSKQTIPVNGPASAEEQSPADEQLQTPGAPAPGETVDAAEVAAELQVEVDLDELGALAAKRDEYLALAAASQRPAGGRPSSSDREPGGIAEDSHLLDGVRLVRSELAAALARVGVESFSPLGETFDPSVHEAMASVDPPVPDTASGTIVEVYQDGYRLGETIIRPARVVVAA
ncbi:MAG TPA: nucleotide exchange factor GrpE [Solirubrobacteraceae bacterium]